MTRPADRYDVVVVGAGLVGLAAAALLAQQGVRVLAVERHAGTSVHPKARLVTVRSMEIYRALGIEAEVRAAGEPNAGFDVAETLAGGVQSWIAPPADEVASAGLSPPVPTHATSSAWSRSSCAAPVSSAPWWRSAPRRRWSTQATRRPRWISLLRA